MFPVLAQSGFTPSFDYTSGAAPTPTFADTQSVIVFDRGHYRSGDAFEKHPDYALFKDQFDTVLTRFKALLRETDREGLSHPAEQAYSNFDVLRTRLFDRNDTYLGNAVHREEWYGLGMKNLRELLVLLQESGTHADHKRETLLRLASVIDVCASGAVSHVTMLVDEFRDRTIGGVAHIFARITPRLGYARVRAASVMRWCAHEGRPGGQGQSPNGGPIHSRFSQRPWSSVVVAFVMGVSGRGLVPMCRRTCASEVVAHSATGVYEPRGRDAHAVVGRSRPLHSVRPRAQRGRPTPTVPPL
jgi:hypothetical protein